MEHWSKTSSMEPLPLGRRRNDKRKLQAGDCSPNKKASTVPPVVHVRQGVFRRPIDDAGEAASCIHVHNKMSLEEIRTMVWSLQQGMTGEEERTEQNLGVGTIKHQAPPPQRFTLLAKLPQDGHPESRILQNGDRKNELGWKKAETQSSGETSKRLRVHDRAKRFHKNPHRDRTGNEQHREVKARTRVMDILHKFRDYCDKLSDMKHHNGNKKERNLKRVDLQAAQMVQKEFGYSTEKQYLGQVPGVKIGDKFCYRMELHILGLHRPPQSGIDTMDYGGEKIATSVVASGGYNDSWKDPNTLIYCGHGGNCGLGNQEQVEDQKLEGGNRALLNSKRAKKPVRVIKGEKKMKACDQCSTIYIYDGLYTVEDMWKIKDTVHHKIVFYFKLVKISGQS